MGTEYFAVVEQQQLHGSWLFIAFWRLDKVYALSAAVHAINPSTGEYVQWKDVSHRLSVAMGDELYHKTELDRQELPKPRPEFGQPYASLVASLEPLRGNVRVLFCQDQ